MKGPAAVNYIRHLNAFFEKVKRDRRLHANHVSLYMALFYIWNQYRFQNPFPILREEAVSLSRIGSLNTYTQCLKALHSFGYIVYHPPSRKGLQSQISIIQLENDDAGKPDENHESGSRNFDPTGINFRIIPLLKSDTTGSRNSDTAAVAILRHLYKQTNNFKTESERFFTPQKNNQLKNVKENEKPDQPQLLCQPPGLQEVIRFFDLENYPAEEAPKFFHHYEANGWLQAGKTPIINWRAAAHKWILNINPKKMRNDGRKHQLGPNLGRLHTRESKDYTDPL